MHIINKSSTKNIVKNSNISHPKPVKPPHIPVNPDVIDKETRKIINDVFPIDDDGGCLVQPQCVQEDLKNNCTNPMPGVAPPTRRNTKAHDLLTI
jgi:hypothetical protein